MQTKRGVVDTAWCLLAGLHSGSSSASWLRSLRQSRRISEYGPRRLTTCVEAHGRDGEGVLNRSGDVW